MYLHLLTFLERARCKRARARAPVSFLRLRQEKNRLVTPVMHEKLSNTMTKLEAAPDTVTKDLRYKFAVPVPRSRPKRRAADASAATDGSAPVNVYGGGSFDRIGRSLELRRGVVELAAGGWRGFGRSSRRRRVVRKVVSLVEPR